MKSLILSLALLVSSSAIAGEIAVDTTQSCREGVEVLFPTVFQDAKYAMKKLLEDKGCKNVSVLLYTPQSCEKQTDGSMLLASDNCTGLVPMGAGDGMKYKPTSCPADTRLMDVVTLVEQPGGAKITKICISTAN